MQKAVAFFINNRTYSDLDCRRIMEGNPGIGGSEFVKLIISYLLSTRDNGIEVTVFTVSKGIFPEEIVQKQVSNLTEAVMVADANNVDYFVFDQNPQNMNLLRNVYPTHLKFITLCHNFVSIHTLDLLAADNRVFKIIAVGREQRDLFRDHPVFYKTDYIYNCVNIDASEKYEVSSYPVTNRKNIVTFIGVINRFKGFHFLAQAWPKIIEAVPDAELYVIGAGNLYDRNIKLGKWGIADEEYENFFMQYLSRNGKVLDSVHFLGIMGEEKNDILLHTKVGVPSLGVPETFGLVAIEMQIMGTSIVTRECPGFLDTIVTGKLIKNRKDLADCIIEELRSPHNNYEKNIERIRQRFSTNSVIEDWEALILTGKINRNEELVNKSFRYKWLKERLRLLKQKYKIFQILPPVEYFISIYSRHFYSRYIRLFGQKNVDYIDTF